MDKITKYKQILKKELERHATIRFANAPEIESRLLIDEGENNFLLMNVGWSNRRYHHGIVFHFEIKNEKVWLLKNNTDTDIGTKLSELGIPKSDIVLGFVNEIERTIEGYAAA